MLPIAKKSVCKQAKQTRRFSDSQERMLAVNRIYAALSLRTKRGSHVLLLQMRGRQYPKEICCTSPSGVNLILPLPVNGFIDTDYKYFPSRFYEFTLTSGYAVHYLPSVDVALYWASYAEVQTRGC
jgi:hypothetical protein